MSPKGKAAELVAFLAGERVDLRGTLRGLPADIDVELAALAVLKIADNTFYFGRNCKALPARVIREVLARDKPGLTHTFLRLAVRDDSIEADWRRALDALLDLDTTYAWGSAQRRAKIRRVAEDPQLLQAVQGAVASSTDKVPLDMLAVLVADGGVASVDALIPHLDSAAYGEHRIERLRRLRVHARSTPFLDALFAEFDAELDQRVATSPAQALGPVIGVGDVEPLWFGVTLGGLTASKYRISARVDVDSRRANWLYVQVSGATYTTFDAVGGFTDNLKLGQCDAADLPAWLATSAARLKLVARDGGFWTVEHIRSGLRGARRDRIGAWLVGRARPG